MKEKLSDLKLPLILIGEIIGCLLLGDSLPLQLKSFLYGFSLTLKEILMTALPFIIFSFLVNSMINIRKETDLNSHEQKDFKRVLETFCFPLLIFSLVCLSNFVSTTVAGFLGAITLNEGNFLKMVSEPLNALHPLWTPSLPRIASNDQALASGVIIGLVISFLGIYWKVDKIRRFAQGCQKASLLFLKRGFIPLIPLFILGFILKIQHDGTLGVIFKDYLPLFCYITLFAFAYIFFLYGVVHNFQIRPWIQSIRSMIPAMLTGFSTMSSASALPLIIQGSEKNTQHSLTRGVVPFVVNIHLIGDCFFIAILALGILMSFGMGLPSPQTYFIFTCFFVVAKFAVAAVPGGGILVMIPILEKYLGFSGEMLSLITALYILFDPIITSANVMGNGAFSMIFIRLYKRLGLIQESPSSSMSAPM